MKIKGGEKEFKLGGFSFIPSGNDAREFGELTRIMGKAELTVFGTTKKTEELIELTNKILENNN